MAGLPRRGEAGGLAVAPGPGDDPSGTAIAGIRSGETPLSLRSARNWIALEIGVALVLLLAAGSARAGTLPFTGTLTLQLGTLPALSGVGAGWPW